MTDDLERRLRERPCGIFRPSILHTEAADEIARLRAENEALREAVKPFAVAAEDLDDTTPDRCSMWEHHVSIDVEAGDFRRAAAAIRTGEAEQ